MQDLKGEVKKMMKVEIEDGNVFVVPEGYEIVRLGLPKEGESFLDGYNNNIVQKCSTDWVSKRGIKDLRFIVKKVTSAYYFIVGLGTNVAVCYVCKEDEGNEFDLNRKKTGNYFTSEETVKKLVEKINRIVQEENDNRTEREVFNSTVEYFLKMQEDKKSEEFGFGKTVSDWVDHVNKGGFNEKPKSGPPPPPPPQRPKLTMYEEGGKEVS
jgi:ribosomal protein S6